MEVAVSHSNLVLPFAVDDGGRKKRLSEDMEVAAVLCLAEAERRKKPGILRGAVETITFLSKLHYPLWLISWETDCLVIDGMATVSNSILYFKPPDVEAFVEHLKSSATVQELYRSALRSHAETFAEFTSQAEISVEGFVTDKEFLSAILAFVKDSKEEINNSSELASLLHPKISAIEAVNIGEKIKQHFTKLQSEIKGLQFAKDVVNEETKMHVDKHRLELEQIRERYEEKISIVSAEVANRREELERERDEKIGKISSANEKEVTARTEEKKRWEQELLRLKQDESEYQKRKELRKRMEDEVGEARWNARLRDIQNQISTMKGKIKPLSDFINRSNKETEKTTKSLLDNYQKLIAEEEKRVTDLENLRDSEVKRQEKEIEELQQETLAISDKIEKLVDQKKERASALKEAAIQWRIEAPCLIYVPFYLSQFATGEEKRHRTYAPVVAKKHEGLVVKIRRKLRSYSLQAKIGTLLKTRSKALENMLVSYEGKLNSDKVAQRGLIQLGMTNNMLTSSGFKERVRRGMEELEAEGWIKPEEKTAILDVYAKN